MNGSLIKNVPKIFRLLPTFLLAGLVLSCVTGCSSPDSKFPFNQLRLNEVRQSSSGQLALIFNTVPERTPGQRIFLVDEKVLHHNISSALQDIHDNPGYTEAFSGGLILHRNHSLTQPGPQTFWIELDPFALSGAWIPRLDQPTLPPNTAASALPASFNPPQTVVSGNENFLWQSAAGPFDTTVSRQPLFMPNRRDTLTGKTEAVLGGTTIVAAYAALVGTVFAVEYLSRGAYDLSYPYGPASYPNHPYRY